MPTVHKCSKCGKEAPSISQLYNYRVDTRTSIDLCVECFDNWFASLQLKPEYVPNPKK